MRQLCSLLHAGTLLLAAPALPAQSADPSPVEARRQDLQRFRTEFLAKDRAYTPDQRAEAETRLTRLEASTDRVSAARFELELAQIVALADNGHTAAFAGPRSRRLNRVPLRLTPFGEEFRVLRAAAAHADLLGARLVAVDGRSIAELRALARTLSGGTPAWRDRHSGFFLESPEQLHALGAADASGHAVYRFELEGRTIERRIEAEPASRERDTNGSGRWLYPAPLAAHGPDWRGPLPPESAPWSLRDVGVPFRWRAAPELEALVIELRQTRDAPDRPIRAWLADMADTIRARAPRHVVIDVRMNGGGDLNTARDFMKGLPAMVPGRIFALTSPWTFSAAISSVGYLKQAAPSRVTIVGEMVGDRLEFWAEGSMVELPHSGAMLLFADERHDYKTGCRPFTDCHGPVVRNPISVPTLEPEIAAPWTFEAWRAGRDPAMEAVARVLAR